MSHLCPNPERCGSCAWSHIPYERQLQQKLSDINGSFKLKKLDERVLEIAASPKTDHYRNRMDFVIDFEGRVGMREKGKWWRVIDDHTCFLGMERIEELFHVIRSWSQTAGLSFYDRKADTGLLRYAVVRATTLGQAMVIVITSKPTEADVEPLKEALQKLATSLTSTTSTTSTTSLIHSINETSSDVSFGTILTTISGPDAIEEEVNGIRYRITPNAFFQTNPYAAPILMDTVREFVGDTDGKTILDLYCGSGFFGIGLAGEGIKVIGAELIGDAIRDARVNAELNGVEVEFHEAATETFDWGTYNADIVILDPPRSGMHDKALADVLRIKPETIVYISCNYKNFARELVFLKEFYDVEAMRAIDMFPHTPHVELVTKLTRK